MVIILIDIRGLGLKTIFLSLLKFFIVKTEYLDSKIV